MNWSELFYCKNQSLFWAAGMKFQHKRAGTLCTGGYIRVMFNKKTYAVHRIVWEIHNGNIPDGMQIDHIDGNKRNNNIENLRLATNAQNRMNTGQCSANRSGVKGVCWHKPTQKWCGRIMVAGESKYLGLFDDIKDAECAVKRAREKYHGPFANHGQKSTSNKGRELC